jgi:tRNA nucleotidyltransferase/poly(A) polymerase
VTPAADIASAASGRPTAATLALALGPVARLLRVLNGAGEEARIVGGAVRNVLLGEPVGDIDIATTAIPDEVARRAGAAGFKVAPTGIIHGTLTIVIDRIPYEVTTLRQDVETFGRNATVRFSRDWRADAERRDFTMNALSVAADGTLYDMVGGLDDLRARRVRFIGDPATRIAEDFLRVLRFFRFHAAYGEGEPDAAGLQACIAARAFLARLSRERVRMEMLKLLLARRAEAGLWAMADAGLLPLILGGVPNVAHFAATVAVENALGLPACPIRRLAALAVMITEDAERLSGKLRLSNIEQERLLSTAQGWWRRIVPAGDKLARPWLYRLGQDFFTDRVVLAWARWGAPTDAPEWRDLVTLPQRWSAPRFPLKASDFMVRGIGKGPALGAALREAEEAWIAADFPSDPAVLGTIVDSAALAAGAAPR